MLKMQKFKIKVLIVPTNLEIALGISKPEEREIEIEGYTLKDAKKRAGIR